jgi:hypothetical protein
MEHIKIDRDTLIQQLIKSTLDHIEMCPETLEAYLTYGFKGFEEYTDEELISEYRDYISEDPNYDVTVELTREDV